MKTANQTSATPRPWQTYNETCISSCGNFPRFVAQTMLDDEDTKPMSQKEVANEQQRAEADALLIVQAVNEYAALVALENNSRLVNTMLHAMLTWSQDLPLPVRQKITHASNLIEKNLAALAAVRGEDLTPSF